MRHDVEYLLYLLHTTWAMTTLQSVESKHSKTNWRGIASHQSTVQAALTQNLAYLTKTWANDTARDILTLKRWDTTNLWQKPLGCDSLFILTWTKNYFCFKQRPSCAFIWSKGRVEDCNVRLAGCVTKAKGNGNDVLMESSREELQKELLLVFGKHFPDNNREL